LKRNFTFSLMGVAPQLHPPFQKGLLRRFPQPLSFHLGKVMALLKGLFLALDSCSTRRVGLTPQTLEVALIPLVRLVSASCHICHNNGLDGGRNDVVSLLPFGAIRCSATLGFSSGHPLGMHPSTSLVADPSRHYELAQQPLSACFHELPPRHLLCISAKSGEQDNRIIAL